MRFLSRGRVSYVSQLALLGVFAWGTDSQPIEPRGDAGVGDGDASAPAVLVATQVITPDAFNLYVGAYPELPAEVEPAGMLEVNGGNDGARTMAASSSGTATRARTRATRSTAATRS